MTCGHVHDPHSCLDLVDVLAALAARAHGGDVQVLVVKLHAADCHVVQHRHHVDAGEGCLALRHRVEGALPHLCAGVGVGVWVCVGVCVCVCVCSH